MFNKSRNLFAMNFAKNDNSGTSFLLAGRVYGRDRLCTRPGFDCAVASLGTALTEEQARLMAARCAKRKW